MGAEVNAIMVITAAHQMALAHGGQPLELDVGLLARRRHQLICGQPRRRNVRADRSEPLSASSLISSRARTRLYASRMTSSQS